MGSGKTSYLQYQVISLVLILCTSNFSHAVCIDINGDGLIDNAGTLDCLCEDADADGWSTCSGDCNDNDPRVNPSKPEICDGQDTDCDGCKPQPDVDQDGDGVALCAGDCNDSDPRRFPGNKEGPIGSPSCSDFIDNDCNFQLDSNDPGCAIPACEMKIAPSGPHMFSLLDKTDDSLIKTQCDWCHYDDKGEHDQRFYCQRCHISPNNSTDPLNGILIEKYPLSAPYGFGEAKSLKEPSSTSLRCAITSSGFHSDTTEICDGMDNNCDGVLGVDELDSDGDGHLICDVTPDCNDFDARIHPGAIEICADNVDNNCDNQIDGIEFLNCSCPDFDSDGWTSCAGDCNDFDASVFPGATELCGDYIDNNCDGLTDLMDLATCLGDCADRDLDGYRDSACGGLDCNDSNDSVNPGMPETCDGQDTNCDGCTAFDDIDADKDGVAACAGDCDDEDISTYPGSSEGPMGTPTCSDLVDNNCNNQIDDSDIGCAVPTCKTRTDPKNGPHMFDLLNEADESILKAPCDWCHFDDSGIVDERTACQRCHADPGDFSDPLNGVLKAKYPRDPPFGFGSAKNVKMHSSRVVGTTYGAWEMSCINCHNPHLQEQNARYGTGHGKYIREYVCYNNAVTNQSVEELIKYTSQLEFADGPPFRENLCEICHTQTNHHQNYGNAPGGQSHNDSKNCMSCHGHAAGLSDRIWGVPPED